jgi:hypothetical protein
MAQNPIRTAAAATGGLVTGSLLEAIVKRFAYILNTGESLSGLDFNVGEPPLIVISADTGFVYFYDAADATTSDDGVTCLVSGTGQRYKASSGDRPFMSSALTFASSPPGSPVVGDVHVVAVAATGAFAGHDDDIALYTRRGWRFASPIVGLTLLVESSGTNWQYTDAGWGAFPVQLAAGSVPPTALQFPGGIVVESTLNAPPGSPTTGKFWIVGSSPTGSFSGHAADLAYWTGSAWAFMDPADGWSVFHKAFGFEVFYLSGSWLGGAGSDFQEFSTAGAFSWTKPAKGNLALVEGIGAGASGSKGSDSNSGPGGGGGAYWWRFIPMSLLASTVNGQVGTGGAARTTGNTGGQAGTDSTFGTWLTAKGGSAGGGAGAAGGNGGANPDGTAAAGGASSGAVGAHGGPFGGGGGGAGTATTGAPGRNGGGAVKGGAGGGGGGRTVSGGLGGISVEGGNGGDGAVDSGNASAGVQPGGGGGGSENGNSGKGGDGRVRVTVF